MNEPMQPPTGGSVEAIRFPDSELCEGCGLRFPLTAMTCEDSSAAWYCPACAEKEIAASPVDATAIHEVFGLYACRVDTGALLDNARAELSALLARGEALEEENAALRARLEEAERNAIHFGDKAFEADVKPWTTHSAGLHLEYFGGSLGLLKLTIAASGRSVPVENGPARCTTITLHELAKALSTPSKEQDHE